MTLATKKMLLFCGVSMPLVVAALFATRRPPTDPHAERWQKKEVQWAKAKYFPVADDGQLRGILSSVKLAGSNALTEDQQQKLRDTLHHWLMAYRNKSYQDFQAFRTPVPVQVDLTPLRTLITNYSRIFNMSFPSDAEECLRKVFEVKTTFTIVAISPSNISVDIVQKRNSKAELADRAFNYYGRMVESLDSCTPFAYNTTPRSIVAAEKMLVCAYISLACRIDKADWLLPISASFYWSGTDGVWLPWEMALDFPRVVNVSDYSLFF
jgi:hypothetical protein